MKELNAVDLRKSLGRLERTLSKGGGPILLKIRGRVIAAIVSMDDFHQRFGLVDAAAQRKRIVERIRAHRRPAVEPLDQTFDELRDRS